MKQILLTTFWAIASVSIALGQGKIVLIGGGSEDENGWSNIPYRWAVENSVNKKVAVISYSDETEFIPDYFKSLGAAEAINIRFNSKAQADQQIMYDSLMKYDVFFFKGGDQSYYYKYFKNTKTAQAITDKFAQGGVMSGTSAGMAILSGVIFTAEKNSVYPDEAMNDFRSSNITLADDLTTLLPGFIGDSHFTERGRVGRMFAFLANWHSRKNIWITGIGVDDRTALCIDASNHGYVYGSGSVSFFSTNNISAFQDEKPVADSIAVIQLLHGHTIDLSTLSIIEGPEDPIITEGERETGTYAVLLSGSDELNTNKDFLDEFQNHGDASDSIILVTSSSSLNPFITELQARNLKFVVLETKSENNADEKLELRNAIRKSKKILFVKNNDASLFQFLNGGKTGALLKNHLFRNEILSGFVGQDSRYAGKTFVTNHLGNLYNAYYGDLNFTKGLALLRSSFVMPDTWKESTTDFYENTTASVPYAMIADTIRYGIYLNRKSFLKFDQELSENYFEARGEYSTPILINKGTLGEFASQPVNSSGDVRDYAGFSEMHYALLNGNKRLKGGMTAISADPDYEFEYLVTNIGEESSEKITFFPNPTQGILKLAASQNEFPAEITVTDVMGRIVLARKIPNSNEQLDLSHVANGFYHVRIFTNGHSHTHSIVVQH